jgi:hypothetical protein
MAYVDSPNQGEGKKVYRQRIYGALRAMGAAGSTPRKMRIVMKYPTVEWHRAWINLHTTWASDSIKAMWFLVIHDLVPTNERLHRINLKVTLRCKVCVEEDTRLHRLIECQGVRAVWDETRRKLAMILRTSPTHIQPNWGLRSQFSVCSIACIDGQIVPGAGYRNLKTVKILD